MVALSARRGVTLAETVISIFLLTAGFVVMTRLFNAALQYQTRIEAEQVAVLLAERKLEELRGFSRDNHGPTGSMPFTAWAGVAGSFTDPNHPGYTVDVSTRWVDLYSPCSLFELEYTNAAQRRVMNRSAREVTVTVSWSDRTYSLVSIIADPGKRPGSVEVTPGGSTTLARDASQNFDAVLRDNNGNVIEDVFFDWYLDGVGDGEVDPRRDGTRMTLTNHILDGDQVPITDSYGHGDCRAVGRAVYKGRDLRDASGTIDVQP